MEGNLELIPLVLQMMTLPPLTSASGLPLSVRRARQVRLLTIAGLGRVGCLMATVGLVRKTFVNYRWLLTVTFLLQMHTVAQSPGIL